MNILKRPDFHLTKHKRQRMQPTGMEVCNGCGAEKDDRLGNEAQAAGNLSDLRVAGSEADETVADADSGL